MSKRKVLPLKGYKALRALNGFHALLLGLKMLPAYAEVPYETFYASFQDKTEDEKETLIREAAVFVELDRDEVEALIGFCTDKNGVPFSPMNIGNLALDELHEVIVAVCMEIGRIKIDLVTDAEKKKIANFSIDVRRCFLNHPELELFELLNLAYLEAVTNVYGNFENQARTR